MRLNKFLAFSLAVGFSLASCKKSSLRGDGTAPAPVMNQYYFLPAYVTDLTAPSFKYVNATTAITTAFADAVYYSTGIPATGVTFTIKDQTGATLTTLTGVPQGTVFFPNQYYVVLLPSSFLIPASWVGKIVTITPSNNGSAFTKYRVI
jgi:hypothetical protein